MRSSFETCEIVLGPRGHQLNLLVQDVIALEAPSCDFRM